MKIRNYFSDLQIPITQPSITYEDNRAVIRYGRDIGMARAASSFVIHFHYGRDLQQQGYIDIRGVTSQENKAYFFTKLQGKGQIPSQLQGDAHCLPGRTPGRRRRRLRFPSVGEVLNQYSPASYSECNVHTQGLPHRLLVRPRGDRASRCASQ